MKEITDTRQQAVSVYDHLAAFFLNEEEVTVPETVQTDDDGNTETRETTKYRYDYYEVAIEGEPSRDTLIDAAIRTRYSSSNQTALVRHKANGDSGYDDEWAAFDGYCERMKKVVDEYLANQ